MNEKMTYVAIDTDNVGESIGNAVIENNTDMLSQISNSINAGVTIFSQWAEYNGGKVVSSGSDEAIFRVPADTIEDLETLKEQYQEKTGFTVSVGMGDKVSDAAKALIYAKMNGKNMIVDYSPEMERAVKESVSNNYGEEYEDPEPSEGYDDADEEEDKMEKDSGEVLEGGLADDKSPEQFDREALIRGVKMEMKHHTDDPTAALEIVMDNLVEDPKYYDEDKKEESDIPEDEIDGDYGSKDMEEGQPDDEKYMTEKEEFIHDAKENREDEADDDIIEADEEDRVHEDLMDPKKDKEAESEGKEEAEEEMEDGSEEEALDDMVDEATAADADVDLDGRPDSKEEHGEITAEDDIDGDGDVEHEEAMYAEAGEEEEYSDEDDWQDEVGDDDEALHDSISSEMQDDQDIGEELPQEMEEEIQEEDGEDDMEEDPSEEQQALKDVIYDSLNNFKQHREYLLEMKQVNPELYTSLIHTLQAMIEMAKDLGFGDMSAESGEEMPEEEMEDTMLSEDAEVMDAPDLEEEKYEKTEAFYRLIDRMNKTFEMYKSDESHTMQDIKEAIESKKKEQKTKGSSKKKKPSIKKPQGASDKKKKDNSKKKDVDEGSFCARSHKKMTSSNKDCRSGEDKNSALCAARRKMKCRGKNQEQGPSIQKSEKLKNFLQKDARKK